MKEASLLAFKTKHFHLPQVKLQEDFDRERERLVRERHEIKIAGGVGVGGLAGVMFGAGGLGGRLGPNDDDKVMGFGKN